MTNKIVLWSTSTTRVVVTSIPALESRIHVLCKTLNSIYNCVCNTIHIMQIRYTLLNETECMHVWQLVLVIDRIGTYICWWLLYCAAKRFVLIVRKPLDKFVCTYYVTEEDFAIKCNVIIITATKEGCYFWAPAGLYLHYAYYIS